MQRADDLDVRRALSSALDAAPIPPLPWASIATRVRVRPSARRRLRWWASSMAVALLLLVVSLASRGGTELHQAVRSIDAAGVAQRRDCAVTVSIPGPTVLQPRGSVAITSSLGPPFVARGAGSGWEGPCGTVLRLTEHPAHPDDIFAGWVISRRPGVFQAVRGRPSTIRLTLRGRNEVVYVKYIVRGSGT